ncbi:hypothetical protein LBMAG30_26490 [Comamonadaceae bacterium]|nr:hypothetical protein LBMAG30_26490 [Comamonadaceae bacterium]
MVEYDFLAYIRSNLFYFNFFAGRNFVLFATGFYDRVHIDLLSFTLRTDFHGARHYNMGQQGPNTELTSVFGPWRAASAQVVRLPASSFQP